MIWVYTKDRTAQGKENRERENRLQQEENKERGKQSKEKKNQKRKEERKGGAGIPIVSPSLCLESLWGVVVFWTAGARTGRWVQERSWPYLWSFFSLLLCFPHPLGVLVLVYVPMYVCMYAWVDEWMDGWMDDVYFVYFVYFVCILCLRSHLNVDLLMAMMAWARGTDENNTRVHRMAGLLRSSAAKRARRTAWSS